MVEATILHFEHVRQAQQRRVPHCGIAFAWLKVRLAAKVGGGFFPFRVFIQTLITQIRVKEAKRRPFREHFRYFIFQGNLSVIFGKG
jgi:uncharacterized paraquat-inducible protein A